MNSPRALLALAAVVWLGGAVNATAQTEGLSFRPFVMGVEQQFAASQTFDAVFGQRNQTLVGGGLNITQETFYLELSASQFKKTGQRAFLNAGQAFRLGIPLRATITPFEMTGGYRFLQWRRVIPYAGGGVGLYKYTETSDFSTDDENVDTRHAGAIVEGGVELRLHRWIGVAVDAHYTYVPGIIGSGGISQDAHENDLGGISARFKVIVGR
jgi:hypothetical protein